jgi:hypothetical protein
MGTKVIVATMCSSSDLSFDTIVAFVVPFRKKVHSSFVL